MIHVSVLITENVTLSRVHRNYCNGNKFFHHHHTAYQFKLSLKKRSQTEKGYSKILSQSIFYPINKDPDPNDRVKIKRKLLSWILPIKSDLRKINTD